MGSRGRETEPGQEEPRPEISRTRKNPHVLKQRCYQMWLRNWVVNSKRVEELVSGYEKPLFGTLAGLKRGLATIRRECPHFRDWLERLETWPQQHGT